MSATNRKIFVEKIHFAGRGGGTSYFPPPTVPPLEIGIRCLRLQSKFDKGHSTVILTVLEAGIEFMTLLKN